MKGYIRRLSQDIEKLDAKIQALVAFKDNPREPINDKQYELLCKQAGLMEQLSDVMKLRLANEREIHPDYFEEYDWSKIRIVSLNDFPRDKDCEGTEAGVVHGDKSYTIFYFEDETLAMTDEEAGKLEDPADEE